MVSVQSNRHIHCSLDVFGSVKSVITYFSLDLWWWGDDTISTRLKYMVLDHRELPFVNSVTSVVA